MTHRIATAGTSTDDQVSENLMRRPLPRRLLTAVSVAALATAAPGLNHAHANINNLPEECSIEDTQAEDKVVNCTSSVNEAIDTTTTEDSAVTLNIGDEDDQVEVRPGSSGSSSNEAAVTMGGRANKP